MTVDITIAFNYEDQYWTKEFKVDQGSTIFRLKEQMLAPKGTKQDVDSFELQLRGQRVSDAEEIYQEHTLDFEFLGPQEGAKRAKEDDLDQKRREREKADALAASRNSASRRAQQAAKPAASSSATVKILVKHAMEEMQSQITVEVPSKCSILELRKAVLSALGESRLSEVKIVKKQGQSFASCGDADSIGSTTTFLSMGRKLEVSVPTGDLVISVTIDKELDFKSTVKVARGSTVSSLKDILSAQDPTGSTQPESFGLGVPKASGAIAALPDSTVLSEKHLELQVTEPYTGPPTSAKVFETIPGTAIWKVVGGSDKGGILVRAGRDTKSTQLTDRLSTGAIVEQLGLEGERLNYQRISGTGPSEGWVSLTVGGKELLRRHPAEGPDAFTFERAVALQTELRDRFSGAEFKGQLVELVRDHPTKKGAEYMRRRAETILAQQLEAIPKYGFEGSQRGVQTMMASFGPHMGSPITQGINNEISVLLTM